MKPDTSKCASEFQNILLGMSKRADRAGLPKTAKALTLARETLDREFKTILHKFQVPSPKKHE